MKKIKLNYRLTAIATLITMGAFFSCETEERVSETGSIVEEPVSVELAARNSNAINCMPGASNSERTIGDIANPVNDGKIDDRSCYSNYTESRVGSRTYGNYNIAVGSNHLGTSLQPRIERSFPRSNSKAGSFVEFKGVFRILEVGDAPSDKDDGTYIAQAKGKHTGGGGPADPAICLFLAKPVHGTDAQGRRTQVSFDIYREQINFRGGSGPDGRSFVRLTNVKKGVATSFELKVGFRNVNGSKVHFANAVIGGTNYFWNIPGPDRGTESGIRYGAYRVKGGKARIQWADTDFTRVNK